jgi:ParB-like chromosome segregation protein Spo0J
MAEVRPNGRNDSPREMHKTCKVALTDIAVLPRLRPLEPPVVNALAVSMSVAGLIHPIVLRSSPAGFHLVLGRHRLEAARKLNWQTIPAIIFPGMTSDQAALAEIESGLRSRSTPKPEERPREEITNGGRGWKAAARKFFGPLGGQTRSGLAVERK